MNTAPLFVTDTTRTIQFQNMKLEMDCVQQGYIGLLELNSNKFYVRFDLQESGLIGEFEIFSAKGYFEFNLKIIKMIRTIVQNMHAIN